MTRAATIDDYLALKLPDDAQISPDGRLIAYTLSEIGKEAKDKPVRSRVWLVRADGAGAPQPLTGGSSSDRSPRWSPRGDCVAFLSDRNDPGKRSQILILPMGGGEATPITEVKGAISELAWLDADRIAYLMADPDPDDATDVIHFEDRPQFQRLYIVNTGSREVTAVSPADVQVWEYEAAPDGQSFAVVASALPWEWSWYQSYIGVVPAVGGAVREVCRTERQVALPRWSPDGRQIAFISSSWSDRGVVAGDLWLVDAAGGAPRDITAGYRGSLTWAVWRDNTSLLFMGLQGVGSAIGVVNIDGRVEPLWTGPAAFTPRHWQRFSIAAGRLAAVREDVDHLPEVYLAELPVGAGSVAWRALTHLNPQADELAWGKTEAISWRSGDGTPIEGLLLTPADYDGASRLPLVTIVHGGPTANYSSRISTLWAPFLAAQGMAVLMPNPRGSTGYGLAFAEANIGDMGGGDLADVLAGVDACISRGIADPERLGIAGWSYGGYLTAWAITQTQRFKAAVVGAGITDWLSFHGVSEIPTWDAAYLKATPYGGAAYSARAPLTHIADVTTPTLMHHGEKDTCVPVGQAYQFHRALRERAVECQLRVYPREPHGLRERAHVKDMQEATVGWFVSHLK